MITANEQTPGLALGNEIDRIRRELLTGELTYDKAKEEAAPVITEMNRRAAVAARRRGLRPGRFSFASLMR